MLPAKAATEASRIRNSTFIDRQGYQSRTVVAPSRKCIVRVGLNQGYGVVRLHAAESNRRTSLTHAIPGNRLSRHGVSMGERPGAICVSTERTMSGSSGRTFLRSGTRCLPSGRLKHAKPSHLQSVQVEVLGITRPLMHAKMQPTVLSKM